MEVFSDVSAAISALLASVESKLVPQTRLNSTSSPETNGVELTPDNRDRLAAFRRKVLVLQEDWQFLEQDFLSGGIPPSNPEEEFERLFSGNRSLWMLFQELRQAILQICPNATCYANTKWICFKRERSFLIVNVLQRHLDSGIAVGENFTHPRVEKRRSKRGYGGWNGWPVEYQGLRIRATTDLDEEFRSLVHYAYENYGLLRGERG